MHTPGDRSATLAHLDRSILRGLVHELANAAQMLALPTPGPGAVAESRNRLEVALAVLGRLAHRGEVRGPASVGEALSEAARWQALQSAWPGVSATIETASGLPAVSASEDQVRDLALALITAAKSAGARSVRLRAEPEGDGCALHCQHDAPGPAPAWAAALADGDLAVVGSEGSVRLRGVTRGSA
jgi:hypothetical protein